MPSLKRKLEKESPNHIISPFNNCIQMKATEMSVENDIDSLVNIPSYQSSAVMQKHVSARVTNKAKELTFRNSCRRTLKKAHRRGNGVDVLCDSRGTVWEVSSIDYKEGGYHTGRNVENCTNSEILGQSDILASKNPRIICTHDAYDIEPPIKKQKFEIPKNSPKVVNNLSKKNKRRKVKSGRKTNVNDNILQPNWKTCNEDEDKETSSHSCKKIICNELDESKLVNELYNPLNFRKSSLESNDCVVADEMQPYHEKKFKGGKMDHANVNINEYKLHNFCDTKNLINNVGENSDSSANKLQEGYLGVKVKNNILVMENNVKEIPRETGYSVVADIKEECANRNENVKKIDLKFNFKVDEQNDSEKIIKSSNSETEAELLVRSRSKKKDELLVNGKENKKENIHSAQSNHMNEIEMECETINVKSMEKLRNKSVKESNCENHPKAVVTKEEDKVNPLFDERMDTEDIRKSSDSESENENLKFKTKKKTKFLVNGKSRRKEKSQPLLSNYMETIENGIGRSESDGTKNEEDEKSCKTDVNIKCEEEREDDDNSVMRMKKRNVSKIYESDDDESKVKITRDCEENVKKDEDGKPLGKIGKKVKSVLVNRTSDSAVSIKKKNVAKICDSGDESEEVLTEKGKEDDEEEEEENGPVFSEDSDEEFFGKKRKKVKRVLIDSEDEEEDVKENDVIIHRKNRSNTIAKYESSEESYSEHEEDINSIGDNTNDDDDDDEDNDSGDCGDSDNSDDDDEDNSGDDEEEDNSDDDDDDNDILSNKRRRRELAMGFLDDEAEEGEETENEEEEEVEDEEVEEENETEDDESLGAERFIDREAKEEMTFVKRKKRKVLVINSDEEGDKEEEKVEPINSESLEKTVHIMKKLTRIMTFGELRSKTLKNLATKEKRINETGSDQSINISTKNSTNQPEDIEETQDNSQLPLTVEEELRSILGEGNKNSRKRKHGKSIRIPERDYESDPEYQRIEN